MQHTSGWALTLTLTLTPTLTLTLTLTLTANQLALRTDAVGKFARDAVGGTTNLALSNFVIQAEEIDNEYKVTKG